jgi:hypothetical protein
VDSSLHSQNSKSSLLFCAYLHTSSTPSWRSIFSTERSVVLGSFFVHSLHLLNALLAELSESLVILVFSNSQQSSFLCALLYTRSMPTWQSFSESSVILVFFLNSQQSSSSNCTTVHMLNAHLAELYRILSDSVCNCVQLHSLASKVFSNLTGLLPELLISVLCLSTSLSDSSEFRSASSVHGSQNLSVLSHPPGMKPQRPSTLKSNTPPAECINNHTFTTYIGNTHRHPYTQNMQEKLLCLY